MAEVALSGNLDFVPLDEVLRLLTRAEQQGSVNVRGDQVRGRIFISKRGIGLATVSDDQTLRRHLINSGYVDDVYLDGVEAGEASLAPLAEDPENGIIALLREMTIDSLYQLTHSGTVFEVTAGATSPFASPSPFDLESTLEDSKRRAEEWSEVSQVVADLSTPIRMNRDIGDRESVKISRSAWKLLSEIGSGASVSTMAGRLGTTEFWTARVAAEMAEKGLLIVEAASVPSAESAVPTEAESVEVSNHNESWWQEPERDTGAVVAAEEEVETEDAEAAEPAQEERGRFFGQFSPKRKDAVDSKLIGEQVDEAEAPAADTDDGLEAVEEDTEAFLEKVFSELESNGQAEKQGSHGLLRRRRLGSVLKELDED